MAGSLAMNCDALIYFESEASRACLITCSRGQCFSSAWLKSERFPFHSKNFYKIAQKLAILPSVICHFITEFDQNLYTSNAVNKNLELFSIKHWKKKEVWTKRAICQHIIPALVLIKKLKCPISEPFSLGSVWLRNFHLTSNMKYVVCRCNEYVDN